MNPVIIAEMQRLMKELGPAMAAREALDAVDTALGPNEDKLGAIILAARNECGRIAKGEGRMTLREATELNSAR